MWQVFELLKSFYNLPYTFYTLQNMAIGNIGMKDQPTYLFFNKKKQVSVCHSTFCMEIVHAWMCFTKLHTSKELDAANTPFLKTCHFGSTRVAIISRVSFFNRFYTVYILSHHKPLATSRNCLFLILSSLWPNFALFVCSFA